METTTEELPKIGAKFIISKEKESSEFDFERLIIEHQKKFPSTAGLIENPQYVKALMNPFRKIHLLPISFFKVKLNTILSLNWFDYVKLWFFIALFGVPTSLFSILSFQGDIWKVLDEATPANEQNMITAVPFLIVIPILVSVFFALFYLKFTHDGYLGLIIEKKVDWLESPVRNYYNKYYDRKLPFNWLIVTISIIIGAGMQIPLLVYGGIKNVSAFTIICGYLSLVLNPILLYIFLVAGYYSILNTRIYSEVLNQITERISEYVEQYGTLLTTENYEIIWALGDTPGRSIRQLENIPIAGILSTLIITLAMFMGISNQIALPIIGMVYPGDGTYAGFMPTMNIPMVADNASVPVLIMLVSIVVAAVMVLIVIFPLYKFNIKMRKFKVKALTELDNYIYSSVMEFEEKYAEFAKQETITVFSLREYISAMKTVPISTGKILKSFLAVWMYVLNIRRILKVFAGEAN